MKANWLKKQTIKHFTIVSALICQAVIGLVFGTCLTAAPVQALESGDIVMSINPSNQDLELTPGATYHGSIKVSNVGRLPFKVKASVRPFYIKDNEYEPDFASESAYTKIYNWITLEKTEFSIEPSSSYELKFDVKVPKDVASGGQYAAIMLLSDSGEEEAAGVNVAAQLAAVLYGHVNGGSLRTEGELIDHSLPKLFSNSDFSVSQTIKNTGNVDFRVEQTMTVTEFFSNREVVNRDSVSSDGQLIGSNIAVVLPGTSRTGILTWTDAPKLGLFNVTQTIRFLDQDYTFSKLVFLCPLWLIVIVLALIIVLVIWLIMKIVKKRRQNNRHSRNDVSHRTRRTDNSDDNSHDTPNA